MKFSQLVRGSLARKPIELEIAGQKVAVDLRMLTPLVQEDIYARARARAKAKGVDDPAIGDPVYDLARAAFLALEACVDPKSSIEAPEKFFAGIDEVLNDEALTTDHLFYIEAQWELLSEEVSPRKGIATDADFLRVLAESQEGDALPFLRLRSSTQADFWLRMVSLCRNLLASKSGSTSALLDLSNGLQKTPSKSITATSAPSASASKATKKPRKGKAS